MSLVDLLLFDAEEALDEPIGAYDEARGYTLVDGRPLVTLSGGRESTETKVDREPPDRESWSRTETSVGNEPRDVETWAATVTITRVSQEADDRDA
jgi:hypothetical protein